MVWKAFYYDILNTPTACGGVRGGILHPRTSFPWKRESRGQGSGRNKKQLVALPSLLDSASSAK